MGLLVAVVPVFADVVVNHAVVLCRTLLVAACCLLLANVCMLTVTTLVACSVLLAVSC